MSTTDHETAAAWLTQEAFDRLKAEHDQLVASRPAVAAEINERREEGDLKENGGYHAAKEEQGKQEARIRQIEELLRTAQVGEAPKNDGVAEPGMVVTVRFTDGDDEETFLIGSREEAMTMTSDIEVYSAASPLGRALTGARTGDSREYTMPSGKTMKVTLVKAEPFHG
ncbi:MAG: transcription elongation factor GreA [Mycobacteriales bacterium]|nr:MAG: transcription elongation factor GreA [Pseudonocardiales bacterium]